MPTYVSESQWIIWIWLVQFEYIETAKQPQIMNYLFLNDELVNQSIDKYKYLKLSECHPVVTIFINQHTHFDVMRWS